MSGHPKGYETVLNFSAAASCTNTATATPKGLVPASTNKSVLLSMAFDISYDQCVSMCCTTANCAAWTWDVDCVIFTAGYTLANAPSRGGYLAGGAPSQSDQVVNGLRSGIYLGGAGTGGYVRQVCMYLFESSMIYIYTSNCEVIMVYV